MTRKILSAAAVLPAAVIAVMCFTACGGSSSSLSDEEKAANTGITEKDGVVGGKLEDGTYKMIKVYLEGEESPKLLSTLEKTKVNMDLVVKGDQIKVLENEYTLKDGKFVGKDDTSTYAVDGSKITVLDSDNSKMIFEKTIKGSLSTVGVNPNKTE